MRTRERVQVLQKLEPIQIHIKLNKSYEESRELANALKDYNVLSDNSKTSAEMAKELGYTKRTIDEKRSILIKNNLIKKRNRKVRIDELKKLSTQRSKPNITYRLPYLSEELMRAANLDTHGEYYYKTEPGDKKIIVTFLNPEEAKKYKSKA